MAKTHFIIQYPKGYTKTNDIILKVRSYGGIIFYAGENTFRIECDRRIKKILQKEISDMLKT